MKTVLMALSSMVTIICIVLAISNYIDQNYNTMSAYITALCGWLVIAYDDVMRFVNSKNNIN